MADNARGIHVSPGVYSREIDMNYAVKSLGITTLGVVGETLKGPAFQAMPISDWREFVDTFGGTNPEKYKGSLYPKYELPYIAKSYLTQSNQLEVVRVLGLSGYNAGPAWLVTADLASGKKMVVAVLRSRGHYYKYRKFDASTGTCACPNDSYDSLVYEVGEINTTENSCGNPARYNSEALTIDYYNPLYSTGNDCADYHFTSSQSNSISISATNYGRFKIKGFVGVHPDGTTYENMASGTPEDKADLFQYPVSLNPYDKDYIINVLGTDPQNGTAPIYVESLYDVALGEAIGNAGDDKAVSISSGLTFYQVYSPADYCGLKPIAGIATINETVLTRKNIGQRYLADRDAVTPNQYKGDAINTAHPYRYETNLPITIGDVISGKTWAASFKESDIDETLNGIRPTEESALAIYKEKALIVPMEVGQVYTVTQNTDSDGKRHYFYKYYPESSVAEYFEEHKDKYVSAATEIGSADTRTVVDPVPILDKLVYGDAIGEEVVKYRMVIVKNMTDNLYYRLKNPAENNAECDDPLYLKYTDATSAKTNDVVYVDCDLNNYKSSYRYASTPWFVSNLMGDFNRIELKKLFRFHTISDGDNSNKEIKVSIENIRPDEGTFDVIVRDITDTDEYQIVLEKYSHCSLVPGSNNYIAYKIGSYDGMYETKSKYITVEVNEDNADGTTIPAGFLGYPQANYSGVEVVDRKDSIEIVNPFFSYNTAYDEDVKNRKQYFGLSSRIGVDLDAFTFKGNAAYIEDPANLTHGFHLDSRLSMEGYDGTENQPTVTVDGEKGYVFDAVSQNNRTNNLTDAPVIGTEELMTNTIYEFVNLRKFTVYFYGGFDGWDVYRDQRTNTDEFKASKYLGTYNDNSGEGYSFNRIEDPEAIGLNQNGITSDWYAYLAGYRQFANPEAVDINVFATPGIDYVNNQTLAEEVIEMIEEERADSIYVVTTPDKPNGASDFVDEMFTPNDAVYNLEDTEINSNYTCTYYPWVKYLDKENNQYIYLPATKDIVRNMAQTDNQYQPWFAPAGLNRGSVDCVRAHFITKVADEDVLYEGRINPIKTFAADGVKIWGQKNLQVEESQLNRIAVRRLLLRMRKLIAIACRSLIFEPNDTTTKNSFLSIVTPILDNIRSNRGISDYKIEVDDSQEARDRRELPAKIFFKPYNALEYIPLDFVLTPEGVSFDDI